MFLDYVTSQKFYHANMNYKFFSRKIYYLAFPEFFSQWNLILWGKTHRNQVIGHIFGTLDKVHFNWFRGGQQVVISNLSHWPIHSYQFILKLSLEMFSLIYIFKMISLYNWVFRIINIHSYRCLPVLFSL